MKIPIKNTWEDDYNRVEKKKNTCLCKKKNSAKKILRDALPIKISEVFCSSVLRAVMNDNPPNSNNKEFCGQYTQAKHNSEIETFFTQVCRRMC